ncbi:MAG: NAD(P)-binding domain-containing protein [Acidimicrobiia bacterium]|nr:NAD(P)-binding domain-containing protein [Acidimicrobiia bacterium]
MKILYADSVDESTLGRLTEAGHDVSVQADLTAETLPQVVADADVLVVRSTQVTAETIAAAKNLGLVVRAGAGTDNIDKDAASARGIYVCNVPGRNAIAVAELTMGLLLAVDRRIADNTADLRQGRWDKKSYTVADGLYGKQLGIVGLGDVGLAVAERAKAFGLTVVAERKSGRSSQALTAIRSIGIRLLDSQDELLATSDVVSIHVPKSEDTIGMVDKSFLAKMKDGAVLLNTSRGDVVDESALLEALDSGRIRAGLDVWDSEPGTGQGEFHSPLAKHPGVIGTHHIGASTSQAQRSIAEGTLETIEAFLGGDPVNCVNIRHEPSGDIRLTVRHLDRVGVLAQVFAVLRAHGLNVQQMQNQVFQGGQAAVASIFVGGTVTDEVIAALEQIDEVIGISSSPTSKH